MTLLSHITSLLSPPRRVSSSTIASPAFIFLMMPFILVEFINCMIGPDVKCMRWLPSCGGEVCYYYDIDGDYDIDLHDWSYIIAEVPNE